MKSAILAEISKIFDQIVDVLLQTTSFHGVLKNELYKDLRAYGPCVFVDILDHHFLDIFHEIVEIWAHKFAVNNCFEAMENVVLGLETC